MKRRTSTRIRRNCMYSFLRKTISNKATSSLSIHCLAHALRVVIVVNIGIGKNKILNGRRSRWQWETGKYGDHCTPRNSLDISRQDKLSWANDAYTSSCCGNYLEGKCTFPPQANCTKCNYLLLMLQQRSI